MIERTLYLALDCLNCYKVFLKKPTKFFRSKTGTIMFLNNNQISIGNYYALHKMFPALKLKPGVCMKLKITKTENEHRIIIMDQNVICRIEVI